MPTQTFFRTWCTKCNDWKLHHNKGLNWDSWYCNDCDNEYDGYILSDIQDDKIKEQRDRYKQSKKMNTRGMLFGMFLAAPMDMIHAFSEVGSDATIIEHDAGQKKIDERTAEKNREEWNRRRKLREEREEEVKKYKHLGRNDICICGSGKKYKKCCLDRIQKY